MHSPAHEAHTARLGMGLRSGRVREQWNYVFFLEFFEIYYRRTDSHYGPDMQCRDCTSYPSYYSRKVVLNYSQEFKLQRRLEQSCIPLLHRSPRL